MEFLMQETHESPDSKHIINKARVGTFMGRLSIAILVGMGLVLVLHILSGNATDALFVAAGMIPIMVSLWLIKRESIELAGMVIAMSLTTMFTALATTGQGVYDIGTVAFPAILIISSLILKRNMVIYLTGFITLCNAWLTFGAIYGLYQPTYPQEVFAGQFLTTTVILFITMGAVYALANTTRNSLDAVHKELQEREKVEKALREAENKYRTLVEETSVIIYRDAPVDEAQPHTSAHRS